MRLIGLTQGKTALVDDTDYDRLKDFSWHAVRISRFGWYAARSVRIGNSVLIVYMHRSILDAPKVDHRDGNGLNNQRNNLRPATTAQNAQNRRKRRTAKCRFKGITLRKSGRYAASIKISGRTQYLGVFDDDESAAAAYGDAAKIAFGEFAKT